MNETLIFCGDLHGKWGELIWKLTSKLDIHNASVIIAGDIGMGFDNSFLYDYQKYEKRLIKNNICIYCVRGNHDNPDFFNGDKRVEYSRDRVKFLQDYVPIEICGKRILPIGGAISIDKEWRLEDMKKHPKKISWWENEDIIRIDLKKIPTDIDIIVSHESPLSFEPIFLNDSNLDKSLLESILSSRRYLDSILFEIGDKPTRWYYGHHHETYSGNYGKLLYKGLSELELQEYRK